MEPVRRRSGLPLWIFFAIAPVVLAVGFIGGMGLASLTAVAKAPPTQTTRKNSGALTSRGMNPNETVLRDSSWLIPTHSPVPAPVEIPLVAISDATLHTVEVNPGAPVATLVEAQAALAGEFPRYGTIAVTYQVLKDGQQSTTLVGVIHAADAEAWNRALEQEQPKLQAWLESVAKRVAPAALKERFHLAWAVIDVVSQQPPGFGDSEVTLQPDSTYRVNRPLAATPDHAQTTVAMRDLNDIRRGAAGGPVLQGSPWFIYGPAHN